MVIGKIFIYEWINFGYMVDVETIDGEIKDIDCIACALQNGELENFGGVIAETDNFEVQQDIEVPIPGFLFIASKKHVKGIADISTEEFLEFAELLHKTRKALKEVLGVEYVNIVQEEESILVASHFHMWLFPRYDWMEKYGMGIKSIRDIIDFARHTMKKEEDLEKLKDSIKKLREYMSK